jgi:heme oxygenase
MISDTHRRLRAATHPCHQRLEDRIDILQRVRTLAGRRTLAQRFHALHTEAEAALAPWLSHVEGLEFEGRRRSPLLARDLEALGAPPAAGPKDPIRVTGVAEALGRLYVLEGSTLGGRVIRREVAAAGGDMDGLSFLDPYGERTGERWRAFLEVVAAETDVEALVAGAVAGFAHAETRLCDEAADRGR